MGRRSIHYLTRSQLYLLSSFHLSRLLLCLFRILKFPQKVPNRNRVLMGRRSIHYLTRSQLYLLCSFHLSRLLLCPFTILKFPQKVPRRNRVFNGEEKHTLLDPFTVIPTLQFSPIAVVIMSIQNFKNSPKKSHAEIEFLMGRRSIHYLTRSQLYLLCSFHLSRLLLCPFRILKFPQKVPRRNRVFNGEEKHTLLDPFTVIPTLQFSPIAGDIRSPITAIGEGFSYSRVMV